MTVLIDKRISRLALSAAFAAGMAAASPALAQSDTQTDTQGATQAAPTGQAQSGQQSVPAPQAMPDAGGQSADYPDGKLKSFAVAFLQVDKVTKQYLPKLKEAKSPDEQQKIRHEASGEMVKAVEGANGISVDEYNAIAKSAQTNPDLANKLSGYIREAAE